MSSLKAPRPGKCLVICEKPSVASDLLNAFGGGTRQDGYFEFALGYITWCFGHMVELVPPVAYTKDWEPWDFGTLPMVPPDYRFKQAVVSGKDGGKGARKQLGVMTNLLKEVDYLVNAGDAGREGELIFWEAARYAGWGKNLPAAVPGPLPAYRFWSSKMTPEGLRASWHEMQPIESKVPLARAAYCRSESDWLLGMNLTRAASLSFPRTWGENKEHAVKVWSVGRVQTPVLALIVRRDLTIENFVSEPFYEVRLTFTPKGSQDAFVASLRVPEGIKAFERSEDASEEGSEKASSSKRPSAFLRREDAQSVLSALLDRKSDLWDVADDTSSGVENPPGLFSLTDLQRWCNQAWGWSAQRTLEAAQAAYESEKVLTYPRTTSSFLPEDSRSEMDSVHGEILSKWLVPTVGAISLPVPTSSPRADYLFDDSKVSDHYAIVPTGIIPKNLEGDVGKIWLAVVRRFLTAFHLPAKTQTVKRSLFLDKGSEAERLAMCSGKVYVDRGWIDLDEKLSALVGGVRKTTDRVLPVCGKEAALQDGELHEGATSPPRAFDEASLLALMENISSKLSDEELEEGEFTLDSLKDALADLGLGTPATRAEIIETLLSRGFIVRGATGPVPKTGKAKTGAKKGKTTAKYLCSTEAGRKLISSLEGIELSYLTEPLLTAQWERRLQDMADGKTQDTREEFLGDLVATLKDAVTLFQKSAPARVASAPAQALDVLCPKSGEPVMDCGGFYRFPGAPDLRLWKKVAERDMAPEDYFSLVSEGKTGVLEGFKAKSGKLFSASLALKAGKLDFVFPERPSTEVAGLVCPKSKKPVLDRGKLYFFPGYPKVAFWKTMAQREMKPEEYAELLEKGKSPLLQGFKSTKGSDFGAFLILKGTEVKFDFPPRDGGAKGGKK